MSILPPTKENIQFAADALREGKLIGLPTETVYGIAAVATNRGAVLSTFDLKGRPAENPLIVHVASMSQVDPLVASIPDSAKKLMATFWPGPLTIILPKSSLVPDEVTAGLQTVAVRMPNHPVARVIIEAANAPLSAPSANRFMSLSPTRAENIAPEIVAGLACVIDGGDCTFGLESTVIDCSDPLQCAILRPGAITRAQIAEVVGSLSLPGTTERRSPGNYRRHYSPRTPLRTVDSLSPNESGIVLGLPSNAHQIQLPNDPVGYGALLYSTLHNLDQLDLTEIVVESPPTSPEWEAVWDRIRKAQG